MNIPSEFAGWNYDQLRGGLVSSVKMRDFEAAHGVMCALVGRAFLGSGPLREMAVVVLGQHEPERLYRDCGHHHEEDDDGQMPDGVFWIGGELEEWVCESGYDATVCRACGIGAEGDALPDGSWPCKTFRPVAEKLVEVLEANR